MLCDKCEFDDLPNYNFGIVFNQDNSQSYIFLSEYPFKNGDDIDYETLYPTLYDNTKYFLAIDKDSEDQNSRAGTFINFFVQTADKYTNVICNT